ncbi:Alpha/Beta hydrolase protein [Thelephora terrestris]|uniref:Alpha/Beta hydrolase protein n=1 Tax=Thelephora terrestris TaxID=56493 RepID=A0A9P6LAV0_9AGAM|nr:Alpha/Beta hydrolase protein [Thelephora terrestris]
MLLKVLVLLGTLLQAGVYAAAISNKRDGGPVVGLSYATFQGASSGGVESFLGIPYAQPPVGNLRFRRPQPPLPSSDTKLVSDLVATTYGDACLQQSYTLPIVSGINYTVLAGFSTKANASEDCLYANVVRPAGVTEQSKLPVVVWVYGGAFAVGDGSTYDGTTVVQRSVQLGEPVIYVNFNYRLNAFGFLGGKEALAGGAANIGLYDQRFFLDWVKTYISKFGGDPNQITAWGQSAGALSVSIHILTNPTNPPFNAAILHSNYAGAIFKTDSQKFQAIYDQLVQFTRCNSALDTLECLRAVPYATLADAVNNTPSFLSPNGLDLTWVPSIDGEFLQKSLSDYLNEGSYARIPVLGGQVDDEGTFFSLNNSQSITTDAEVKAFMKAHLFLGATDAQVDLLASKYSQDPAAGSPFGTGNLSDFTPEFKRLAAIQGDTVMQSGRRLAFSKWATTQNIWSFLWKRDKNILYLGSVHGADLAELYDITGGDHLGADAVVNFINHQDPNYSKDSTASSVLSKIAWPKYTVDSKQMLLFSDNATEEYTTIPDTYRADAIDTIMEVQAALGQ